MMYGFGGQGWGMGFGWLFGIIVLFFFIRIISKTISPAHLSGQKSALDILKERYTRGEISKEEFKEKKHQVS